MNSKELIAIRLKVDDLYNVIKGATADLTDLRVRCPHPEWRIGDYAWAIGHTFTARICKYCDECLGQVEATQVPETRSSATSLGEHKCK